jgi:hypothetical protein
MADSKITALTAISTVDPTADPLVIVDVSDTSMAASGTTKKSTINQLLGSGGTATLASATITGDLTVDTSTLKVDSANNRVGIGTATPARPLDIVGSFQSTLGWVLTGTPAGLGAATRYIGGAGGTDSWYFNALTGGSHLWAFGESLAMTLNSTGLGVGGSPGYKLDVAGSSAGVLRLVNINNLSTDPAAVTRLSIDGQGATWHLDNERTNGIFKITRNSTACLTIDNSGNVGVGVTPAGTGGCLQLKSGITFPATQVASSDANTLDDYEEGTFTPTVVGSTAAGTGTYSNQTGYYTKVGRLVTVTVYLNWTAHTGTGDLRFASLPFTASSSATNYNGISIAFVQNIALTAGNVLYGSLPLATSYVSALQGPTGGGSVAAVPMDTAGEIAFTATYFV